MDETEADKVDPIHQFAINSIAGVEHFGFTNSALFMAITVALIAALMILGTSQKAIVPGRIQSIAEMAYEFVANMLRESAGREGMRFFPLIFSLFMFILFANVIGLVPYFFTVTSHIIVTFCLAMLVITTVIVYGFTRHGLGFLKLFWPSGVPVLAMPVIVPIEIISFLSRPISLSVRLFANMLAGHIALKVFASFIVMLGSFGVLGYIGAVVPFVMTVALTALELLVAFLQAYVFAVLSSMYLNDALHPSH